MPPDLLKRSEFIDEQLKKLGDDAEVNRKILFDVYEKGEYAGYKNKQDDVSQLYKVENCQLLC